MGVFFRQFLGNCNELSLFEIDDQSTILDLAALLYSHLLPLNRENLRKTHGKALSCEMKILGKISIEFRVATSLKAGA